MRLISPNKTGSPTPALLMLAGNLIGCALSVSMLCGCRTMPEARYVSRAPDYGVIAMPRDTPQNRQRAEALMKSHFPEGYEVIWEGEEAVRVPGPYIASQHDSDTSGGRRADPAFTGMQQEADFQRTIDDMPGTPQGMQGYSPGAMPNSVNVASGNFPLASSGGSIGSEWRITYRKKGSNTRLPGSQVISGSQSLFNFAQNETSEAGPANVADVATPAAADPISLTGDQSAAAPAAMKAPAAPNTRAASSTPAATYAPSEPFSWGDPLFPDGQEPAFDPEPWGGN